MTPKPTDSRDEKLLENYVGSFITVNTRRKSWEIQHKSKENETCFSRYPLCKPLPRFKTQYQIKYKISDIPSHTFNGQFLIPLPHRTGRKWFLPIPRKWAKLRCAKTKDSLHLSKWGGDLSPRFEGVGGGGGVLGEGGGDLNRNCCTMASALKQCNRARRVWIWNSNWIA